jgi:hypothetical protein
MPSVVVNDDSIGEALGTLAKGFSAANDPKRRAEALYLQQRINLTAQQAQALADQRAAAESASGAYNTALAWQRSQIQPTVSVLPGPGEMGPLQQTTPNPQLGEFDANAPFARRVMAGSLAHATSAQDFAGGAGRAYGTGQLVTSGMPTTQTGALKLGGIMEGRMLDASKPYTAGEAERQRVLANEEAVRKYQFEQDQQTLRNEADNSAAMQRQLRGDLTLDPNKRVILDAERARIMGQPREPQTPSLLGKDQTLTRADGTVVYGAGVGPNAEPDNPFAFGGTAMDARARDILVKYDTLRRTNPSAITPEIQRTAEQADDHLYEVKQEGRYRDNGEQYWVDTRKKRPPDAINPRDGLTPVVTQPPPPSVNTNAVPAINAVTGGPGVPTAAPAAPAPTDSPVTVTKPGAPAPPGADYGRRAGYLASAANGGLEMVGMIKEENYRPGVAAKIFSKTGGPPGEQSGAIHEVQRQVGRFAQNIADPKYNRFAGSANMLLNFLLRDESGAVIGQSEFARYEDMLVPHAQDSERDIEIKMERIEKVLEARRLGMRAEDISAFIGVPVSDQMKAKLEQDRVKFQQMPPEQQAAYRQQWTAQKGNAPSSAALAPAAAPTAAADDFSDVRRMLGIR